MTTQLSSGNEMAVTTAGGDDRMSKWREQMNIEKGMLAQFAREGTWRYIACAHL